MAMTYEESAALMSDMVFAGRVKVACLKFAESIIIEAPSVPSHNARYRWAQMTFSSPDTVARQIQPPTVMDPGVQAAGATVDDATLQAAVETVVNQII